MKLALALCLCVFAAAASAQRPVPVTNSEIPLQFEFFTVKPPAGSNWFMLAREHDGVIFGKPPSTPGHTQMAMVVAKKLPAPLADVRTYLAEFRKEIDRRLPQGRHTVREASIVTDPLLPEFCVRFRVKATDTGVKGREGTAVNFLISGIHCVEPGKRELVVEASFSERGGPEQWSAGLEAEGEGFLAGMKIPVVPQSAPASDTK